MELATKIWKDIKKIRDEKPLIQNITNFVVMNNTANALLALGASPVMAHAIEELDDMVKIARALVINIGTLDNHWTSSIYEALNAAEKYQTPVVLDPVGAGATKLRTKTVQHIIDRKVPDIICGNGSEIISMAGIDFQTKGVDSIDSSDDAIEAGEELAQKFDSNVIITGKIDHVISKTGKREVHNGVKMMGRITGLGCTASALAGAFLSVSDNSFEAALGSITSLNIAGELAAARAEGPGSLQMHILDALYNLDEHAIKNNIKVE
jgi:hydroxyethylthiazole kinase